MVTCRSDEQDFGRVRSVYILRYLPLGEMLINTVDAACDDAWDHESITLPTNPECGCFLQSILAAREVQVKLEFPTSSKRTFRRSFQ